MSVPSRRDLSGHWRSVGELLLPGGGLASERSRLAELLPGLERLYLGEGREGLGVAAEDLSLPAADSRGGVERPPESEVREAVGAETIDSETAALRADTSEAAAHVASREPLARTAAVRNGMGSGPVGGTAQQQGGMGHRRGTGDRGRVEQPAETGSEAASDSFRNAVPGAGSEVCEEAEGWLGQLEREELREAHETLLGVYLGCRLPADSFARWRVSGDRAPAAWGVLALASVRGNAAAELPRPLESPLAVAARLLGRLEEEAASGNSPGTEGPASFESELAGPRLSLWQRRRRWAEGGPGALEARSSEGPLRVDEVVDEVQRWLDLGKVARARTELESSGAAALDGQLAALQVQIGVLCGAVPSDSELRLLRSLRQRPPLPTRLAELAEGDPRFARSLDLRPSDLVALEHGRAAGEPAEERRGVGTARDGGEPGAGVLRRERAHLQTLGAARAGVFAAGPAGEAWCVESHAAPALRETLPEWVEEADGAVRDPRRPEHAVVARVERVVRHADPGSRLEQGAPGCRALLLLPIVDARAEAAGWIRLEFEHHLLPSQAAQADLAAAYRGAVLARVARASGSGALGIGAPVIGAPVIGTPVAGSLGLRVLHEPSGGAEGHDREPVLDERSRLGRNPGEGWPGEPVGARGRVTDLETSEPVRSKGLALGGRVAVDSLPDGDPRREAVHAWFGSCSIKLGRRRWYLIRASIEGWVVLDSAGAALEDWRDRLSEGRALDRARRTRTAIVYGDEGKGDSLGVHEQGRSGLVVPLDAWQAPGHVFLLESCRRGDLGEAELQRLVERRPDLEESLARASFRAWYREHWGADLCTELLHDGSSADLARLARSGRVMTLSGGVGAGKRCLSRWLHWLAAGPDGPNGPGPGPAGDLPHSRGRWSELRLDGDPARVMERLASRDRGRASHGGGAGAAGRSSGRPNGSGSPLGDRDGARVPAPVPPETLYVSGIESAVLEVQAALARALRVQGPPGATRWILGVDPRVALRNAELARVVDQLALPLPDLVERREHVEELVDLLLRNAARAQRSEVPSLTLDARALLWRQPWRGNVGELEALLLKLCLLRPGKRLGVEEIAQVAQTFRLKLLARLPSKRPDARAIAAALEVTRLGSGRINKTRAALYLGWDPDTLQARLAAGR